MRSVWSGCEVPGEVQHDAGYANAPGGYDQVYDWAYAVLLAGDPFDYKKVAR